MKNLLLLLILSLMVTKSFAVMKLNQTPTLPYNLAVSAGKVDNASIAHGFFESTNLTTTEKTVWHGPGIYVYPTGLVQLTVSSTSALDTLAGTGMQKVSVNCLDINYEPFVETIDLDGQNAVTMSGSCFRIQGTGVRGVQVGSTDANQGIVYVGSGAVVAGVPATIFNLITIGENTSDSGFFTIPAGYKGFFYDVQASSVSNKPLQMRGISRNEIPVFTNFWVNNVDGYVDSKPPFPDHFHEKTDIQFRATMDSGNGAVTAHAHLLLIK